MATCSPDIQVEEENQKIHIGDKKDKKDKLTDSVAFIRSVTSDRKSEGESPIDRRNARLIENARLHRDPMAGIHHHPHDYEWILQQVDRLDFQEMSRILCEYSARWKEDYDAEPKAIRKEGAARRSANTWLRELLHGKTGG